MELPCGAPHLRSPPPGCCLSSFICCFIVSMDSSFFLLFSGSFSNTSAVVATRISATTDSPAGPCWSVLVFFSRLLARRHWKRAMSRGLATGLCLPPLRGCSGNSLSSAAQGGSSTDSSESARLAVRASANSTLHEFAPSHSEPHAPTNSPAKPNQTERLESTAWTSLLHTLLVGPLAALGARSPMYCGKKPVKCFMMSGERICRNLVESATNTCSFSGTSSWKRSGPSASLRAEFAR